MCTMKTLHFARDKSASNDCVKTKEERETNFSSEGVSKASEAILNNNNFGVFHLKIFFYREKLKNNFNARIFMMNRVIS